jgi:hypothetical protein
MLLTVVVVIDAIDYTPNTRRPIVELRSRGNALAGRFV